VSRIDSHKRPAETIQRGLWRGRAHGYPQQCSCFVLKQSRNHPAVKRYEFPPSDKGVKGFPGLPPKQQRIPEPTARPSILIIGLNRLHRSKNKEPTLEHADS
jgi:hypothetical protein